MIGATSVVTVFLGKKTFHKPDYLLGKLPVSTGHCPSDCGYMDSTNNSIFGLGPGHTTSIPVMFQNNSFTTASNVELTPMQSYLALSVWYTAFVGFVYTIVIAMAVSLITGGL